MLVEYAGMMAIILGTTDELTIKNYIRGQDVSNVDNQHRLFN